MVNKDRIVPVTKTDLLSLYATVFQVLLSSEGNLGYLSADNPCGDFTVSQNTAELRAVLTLASEPMRSLTIEGELPSGFRAVIYFIPTVDFVGFKSVIDGETAEIPYDGDLLADGVTLHMLRYAAGSPSVDVGAIGVPVTSDDGGDDGGDAGSGE